MSRANLFSTVQITLIAILGGVVVWLAISNNNLSTDIRNNQYTSCVKGNATRLQTGKILNDIVSLPAVSAPGTFRSGKLDKQQTKFLPVLRAEIAANYEKQNNCMVLK
jgi:hypothetical protein